MDNSAKKLSSLTGWFIVKYDEGLERFEIVWDVKNNMYSFGNTLEEAIINAIKDRAAFEAMPHRMPLDTSCKYDTK